MKSSFTEVSCSENRLPGGYVTICIALLITQRGNSGCIIKDIVHGKLPQVMYFHVSNVNQTLLCFNLQRLALDLQFYMLSLFVAVYLRSVDCFKILHTRKWFRVHKASSWAQHLAAEEE